MGTHDIVVSLCVLDWLNDDQLDKLFAISQHADFLHAISEKRFRPQQLLHRAYVYLAYGYRSNGYVPRYLTAAYVEALAKKYNVQEVRFFRDSRLSFGAISSSLPIATKASEVSKGSVSE